tara:strand:- start:114 stop:794 length:681 start_codon:yes stop_codon:yes gene_type:complete
VKKFEAIILAGGKGTRVKKYTKNKPKCLIKVNGKPFLYYQLDFLKKNNINNVIVSAGYLNKKIKLYVNNFIDFINVKIVSDGKPLGTGGATFKSLKYLKNNFFIIYGDSYFNFKIHKLVKRNLATMAIFKNNNKYDKSNIEIKNQGKILYYKNNINKKLKFIDYGVSFVNKQIFKGIEKNKKFDLSEFFQEISKKNMLSGYEVKKRFYEIGSYSGIKDFKNYLKKK